MILVTIPAYNEEDTVFSVVKGIEVALDAFKGLDYKVVVVSDGSTDKTTEEAERAGAVVYVKPHSGLADTFRYEMQIARDMKPDVIVHTDADGQYDARDIMVLVAYVNMGIDLVLGNRLWHRPLGMPLTKYVANKVGSASYSLMLGVNIPDITTGLRAFNCNVVDLPIVSKQTYTQEQVFRAIKADYVVDSVSVTFMPRVVGSSRLIGTPWSYMLRSAFDMVRFIRGKPRFEKVIGRLLD